MSTTNTTLADRIGAITNSIASGNNACGSLISKQTGQLNHAFIEESVRPTLEQYEGELADLRKERDALLREVAVLILLLE